MSRSYKNPNGRRTRCLSCAPGCMCDWCYSGVERREFRQGPEIEEQLDELDEFLRGVKTGG